MEQELDKGWLDGIHPEDLDYFTDIVQSAIARQVEFRTEYRLRRNDGVYRWVLETGVPRFTDGIFAGYIGSCLDITDRKEAEERLKYMSIHDQLTDLYNRAFFEEWMNRLEQSRLFPISMVMIDMDGLKAINDAHGHAAGDKLLQRAAKILMASFRGEDIVARIGGDEFAVWLPNTDEITACQIIERLRGRLQMDNAITSGPSVGLSIGVATAIYPGVLAEMLILADARMYQDKNARKDVVKRGASNGDA